MTIQVKVKLEFEVEYPLNMDFYEGSKEDAMAFEKSILEADPTLLIDLFGDKSVPIITIEEVGKGMSEDKNDVPLLVTLKDECPLDHIYFIGKLESIKDGAWQPQKKDTE